MKYLNEIANGLREGARLMRAAADVLRILANAADDAAELIDKLAAEHER